MAMCAVVADVAEKEVLQSHGVIALLRVASSRCRVAGAARGNASA